jgi:hypothetical protein
MTAAQVVHFLIIIGLGILAFITFIVAATIMGLMIVEDSKCACVEYPIGLYVLGFLGLLLLISLIRALVLDTPIFDAAWLSRNQQALIIALIVLLALIIIL